LKEKDPKKQKCPQKVKNDATRHKRERKQNYKERFSKTKQEKKLN